MENQSKGLSSKEESRVLLEEGRKNLTNVRLLSLAAASVYLNGNLSSRALFDLAFLQALQVVREIAKSQIDPSKKVLGLPVYVQEVEDRARAMYDEIGKVLGLPPPIIMMMKETSIGATKEEQGEK